MVNDKNTDDDIGGFQTRTDVALGEKKSKKKEVEKEESKKKR